MGNMDDIQRAIAYLGNGARTLKKYNIDQKCVDVYNTAVSAMQELQQYRELGTIDELAEIQNILLRDAPCLRRYKKIGTLEECREARRRQQAVPPRKAFMFEGKTAENIVRMGTKNYETYRCPECNEIVAERTLMKIIYPDGFIKHKFCKGCGQKMDWGNVT